MHFSLKNDKLTKWKYADGVDNIELNMLQMCEQSLLKVIGTLGISSRDCYDCLEEKGFSRRTIERAKSNLGVKSKKQGHHWIWYLE